MEVKIKNGEEMIDATIEMVDGVMVVSPKVVKFEPKDGDVVATKDGQQVFINKKYLEEGCGYAYIGWNFGNDAEFIEGQWCYSRFATEEEKKLLFDKLKEKGFDWDAEKKEIVKIEWKPEFDTTYYKPLLSVYQFRVASVRWYNLKEDEELYQKGWVFQTNEDCAVFVDKLNQAIEGVKP